MKKTKKNTILRLAVLLFALTLLSTGLLGGTLAKYVSSGTVTDSARVAKWGVEIQAGSTDKFFKTEYDTDEKGGDIGTLSVKATADVGNKPDKVLAPGTSGTLAAFTVTGTPEVASRLTVEVNDTSKLDGWVLENNTAYEPVLWTLTKDKNATSVTRGKFSDLTTALKDITADFAPGDNLANQALNYEISWEWPFEHDGTDAPISNDVNDTYLGNLSTAPTITLDFDITITQID